MSIYVNNTIEISFLNPIKSIYQKPTAHNTSSDEILGTLPVESGTGKVHRYHTNIRVVKT